MSRIPSGLLYLAIYNPTLRPKHPFDDTDEDAEEQAHILFYTSKETAVSRDRMLRQIGLAKALVNFSGLFNPNEVCESIHSQSRRMVLVSPEPNFWINAAVELPKKPLKSTASNTGTSRGKPKTTAQSQASKKVEVGYDYEDGTVHDIAIKHHLLHAYEKFKLRHGSLTAILNELGQEALELQLERFFTPWAWSWDLGSKPELSGQLGLPLQPYYGALIPLVDGYSANLPETLIPVVLSPTHIIPSTRYVERSYPAALAEHLMTLIPPPTAVAEDVMAPSVDTIEQAASADSNAPNSTGIFGLPSVAMPNVKWDWLRFGSKSSRSPSPSSPGKEPPKNEEQNPVEEDGAKKQEDGTTDLPSPKKSVEVEVDAKALEDALSSEGLSDNAQESGRDPSAESQEAGSSNDASKDTSQVSDAPEGQSDDENITLQVEMVSSSPQSSMTILPRPRVPASRSPSPPHGSPSFSTCRVYLASPAGHVATQKCEVYYYIQSEMMLAVIAGPGAPSTVEIEDILTEEGRQAIQLLDDIELTIQNAALSKLSESLPTMSKILQTPDRYAISTDQFALQSPGFSSDSSHLQNATALMDRDPDILEVFSRGQNPQYWHVAKRGLSTEEEGGQHRGIAYLEVFKKESSLPDVDNALAGILRRSGIGESGLV